jgi:hypothetical protein
MTINKENETFLRLFMCKILEHGFEDHDEVTGDSIVDAETRYRNGIFRDKTIMKTFERINFLFEGSYPDNMFYNLIYSWCIKKSPEAEEARKELRNAIDKLVKIKKEEEKLYLKRR